MNTALVVQDLITRTRPCKSSRPTHTQCPWALTRSAPDQSLQNRMHFRYYGSNMGRFMKPDNIPGNLANPQSWNLYSYVHGNPVNFNDPTGHMAQFTDKEKEEQLKQHKGDLEGGATGSHLENPDDYDPSLKQASSQGAQTLSTPGAPIKTLFGDFSFELNPPAPLASSQSPAYAIPPPFGIDAIGDLIRGKGYLDFNLSAAFGLGGTAGIQFNGKGAHLYGGGAVGFGVGGALTWSPQNITPGWAHGLQLTTIISFQTGQAGGNYFEIGGGLPAGAAWSFYYLQEKPLQLRWGGYRNPTKENPIPAFAPFNW